MGSRLDVGRGVWHAGRKVVAGSAEEGIIVFVRKSNYNGIKNK